MIKNTDHERKYPPSFYRYREANSTISVTLNKSLKETLEKIKGEGESWGQVIKRLVSNLEGVVEEIRVVELGTCKYYGKALQWNLNNPEDKALLSKLINRDGSFIHSDCKQLI